MEEPVTILGLLEAVARERPGAPAIVAPGRPDLDHAGLVERVRATIASLRAAGVGPGDLLALVLPPGPELAVAGIAAMCGAVAAPLAPGLREAEYERLLASPRPPAAVVLRAGEDGPARKAAARLGLRALELMPREGPAGT